MDQRGVGKIHRTVPVARHQSLQLGQIGVVDFAENDRSRTNELPRRLHLVARISYQVEDFSEYCLGGQQGQSQLAKGVHASAVPAVASVEQRQNRACIDQTMNVQTMRVRSVSAWGMSDRTKPPSGHDDA